MSKIYKPKIETGREFVDYTKVFCSRTIFYCIRLPRRWENILLRPLVNIAQDIEAETIKANKIYVNPKKMDTDALLKAYNERINSLQHALRMFASFDVAFDRLMSYTDILGAERKRMRNLILNIVKEAQKSDPSVKEITINVKDHGSEMEYISLGGEKRMKLGLTVQNRNVWLQSEAEAQKWIQKRIASDKSAISQLKQQAVSAE